MKYLKLKKIEVLKKQIQDAMGTNTFDAEV